MSTGESQLLAGRYRIVSRLGRGGMGVVWRAHDEVLGREVAVKELRAYTDASAPELGDLRLRMQREARAAARVRHPSVIAVHDVTEHEGRPVIVMELVDGPSLDDVLTERGVLEPAEAAAIGAKVLQALAAAHRVGVLHRDVKPGNVLLDASGRVVLTDFGIAAMDDPGDGSRTHLTRSGELVGSLDYLAPERAQGQDPGPASDIWALGATLYAAVEGAAPFRRTSTWSTLNAIVVDPLPEARRAGPLGPVLLRLMDKDPARRPDAETAARLLEEVAGGHGAAPSGPTAVQTVPTAVPPRSSTVRDVLPHRPDGFGPAMPAGTPGGEPHLAPQAPQAFGPVITHVPEARPSDGRGRGRVLVAAGVAAVVLAGAGVGYALLDREDTSGGGQQAVGAARSAAPGASDDPGDAARLGGTADAPSGSPKASPSGSPSGAGAKPSASGSPAKGDDAKGAAGRTPDAKKNTPSASGPGGPGGAGGGAAPPAGSCQPIAGGKVNCQVWRSAKSIRQDGTAAGVLNAGTNYFYCQTNLGRRETYGKWTNTWWARTDDDSGNTNVYVSVVYVKGGANDEPVPGLKPC
ncbi:Serine/threonine-protein kinase PrkC [Streptomyces hundungensis]|uniref:non-specific serine/threonine protein kinase n=1 Tax=Streptomyces hundungensis TaxID=1077946 RepID=A0A387HKE7_9ACTN|nr:serine/threonine-protein kinase [Streptomyces hundungensis]AYG84346.1 Serine/threonine-protein kinase PrkC [Streptomyces hundungensis]